MKISQLVGPFEKDVTYACPVPAGRYNFIQIGIQVPQVPPLSEIDLDDMVSFILDLDNQKFRINANDILEFADINVTRSIRFTPQQDMDYYTIVDVAYIAALD